ncbi:MAG: hypothetical protein HC790_01015 [Acaryochloridaceae cyanobacterium CSU_3_4]|nr:hypothetical protein [Acaryochloris sp. SU_5_25]NJN37611.1 hypothetical protein [Acaryochloridaceae cyanobacterium CSU_3_4]
MNTEIDLIFVPQGAEYQSVCQGLKSIGLPPEKIVSIPMGPRGVTQFLSHWLQEFSPTWGTPPQAILLGLCGSLTTRLSVGDGVIYQTCLDTTGITLDGIRATDVPSLDCDPQITQNLCQQLSGRGMPTTAVSCDRILHTATEKRQFAQTYGADVVDMEGFAALKSLQPYLSLGMVRVVSDDAHHDLPDLNAALSPEGILQPWPLAREMLRQPIPAGRLIRGSLQGLKQLEQLTAQIFAPSGYR